MSDFRLPEEIRHTILAQGLALQREVASGLLASLTTDQREAVFNLYWVLEEAGIAPALPALPREECALKRCNPTPAPESEEAKP